MTILLLKPIATDICTHPNHGSKGLHSHCLGSVEISIYGESKEHTYSAYITNDGEVEVLWVIAKDDITEAKNVDLPDSAVAELKRLIAEVHKSS